MRTPAEVSLGDLGTARFHHLGEPGRGRPTIWLVDAPQWFHRGAIYDDADDGHLRFAALVRAALALADARGVYPDVLHLNDWHTAIGPVMADTGQWRDVPTVLTIHNLAFQGWLPTADLAPMGVEVDGLDPADVAKGWVSTLKEGIRAATVVTTVSPGFAREIIQPGQGMGLEADLERIGDRLVGILNGIGDDWNPLADPALAAPFGPEDLAGKAVNTAALRERLGLVDRDVPVLGIVSRLTEQKGFPLLRETIPPLLAYRRAQLVVIGTGEPDLEAMFSEMASEFPDDAAYVHEFDIALSHLIEAGSDVFLMPSRFEPSGLNQMYSMAYGTIPVVHRTGGLADSVEPWDGAAGTGTGFVFSPHTQEAFAAALDDALAAWSEPEVRRRIIANGMARDDSWAARADDYREVYRKVQRIHRSGSG